MTALMNLALVGKVSLLLLCAVECLLIYYSVWPPILSESVC